MKFNEISNLKPLPQITQLNTIEDFQQLINDRGYKKPLDFMKDFGSGYKKLINLKLTKKVKYPENSKYQEYSNLTINDIQDIIENKKIYSLRQLGERVSMFLVTYIKDMGWENDLKFKTTKNTSDFSHLNSIEAFQKFIDDNKFSSSADLRKYSEYLYNKLVKLGFNDDVFYITSYNHRGKSKDIFKYGDYYGLTIEQIQDIITENEIYSLSQLYRYFSRKLYKYIIDNRFESSLTFKSFGKTHDYHTWKRFPEINTLELTQKFIEDNNISSRADFRNRFGVVYKRSKDLGYFDELCFSSVPSIAIINGFDSSWEQKMYKFLEDSLRSDDLEIKHNVPSLDCVDIKPLVFDIEIYVRPINYFIYIEIQGPTHFRDYLENTNLEYTRKHDIMKNEWINKNDNMSILYFSYNKHLAENFEYPYEIITEEETLLEKIKEIINNGNRE